MKPRVLTTLTAFLVVGMLLESRWSVGQTSSQERLVRIAELEIDPASLGVYKLALRREIEASIRLEPGVLSLYAVSVKSQPNQIRLFEVYASSDAYQAHLQSEHFRRYKTATASMVKALKFIETEPIELGAK